MTRTSSTSLVWLTLSCFLLACGGNTPPAEDPESASVEEEAPEPSGAAAEAGHDLDVGMEFADEDEEEESDDDADRGHEPPPTQTYSPQRRMEEDSKAIGESDASP